MQLLKPSSDRKTRSYDSQKNTFGLLPGPEGTCPGATAAAKGCWFKAPGRKTSTCYVDNIMRLYKGVYGILEYNTRVLREAAASATPIQSMVEILDAEFTRFKDAETKHQAKTAEPLSLNYRLHWAGDIFNTDYAQALHQAMVKHPEIHFWNYTRSFFAVPYIINTPNLIQYLSLDPVNITEGLITYTDCNGPNNPRLQLCYMGRDEPSDTAPLKHLPYDNFEQMRQHTFEILTARNDVRKMLGQSVKQINWLAQLRFSACPVDIGKIKLENGCVNCKRCTTAGTEPVWFAS
jgi:hypothetical protein